MRRPDLYTRTVWAIGFIVVLTAASSILVRWRERSDEIGAATTAATNYAAIIAEQVSNASLAVELSLRSVVEHDVDRTSATSFVNTARSREFHEALAASLARLPQAEVITVSDSTGAVVATTRAFPAPAIDISDRDYFTRLRDVAADDVYVSAPVHNKGSGAWTVFFARGLRTPSGEFLGVAVIGVQPEVFVQTPRSLSEVRGQSFMLARRDGVVYMRRPDSRDRVGSLMPVSSEWFPVVERGGGVYRSPGVFDPSPKFVAVRPLSNYPFVVTVAITEEAALANWRRRTILVIAAAAVLITLLAVLLWLLRAQYNDVELSRARVQRREEQLAATNERLGAALENMSHGLAMFDREERLVVSNRNYAEIYGLRPEQMRSGMTIDQVMSLRTAAGLVDNLSSSALQTLFARQEIERTIVRLSDGRSIALRRRRLPTTGGWVTTHEDVTEQVGHVEKVEFLAMHDALTGLWNRAEFIARLKGAVEPALKDRSRLSLLLIDLDGFKSINDALGHGVGDDVLLQMASRLEACAQGQIVARLGGDEFAILHESSPADSADALAERLLDIARAPFSVGRRQLSISLSIGLADVAADRRDVEEIMRHADLALYAAKRAGRNRAQWFEPQMEIEFHERAHLVDDLRESIERGALDIHYQPIFDVETQTVVSMEALARWPHPTRGMVPPNIFIRAAEQAGLIPALGAWILKRACADAMGWPTHVALAVNCSTLQIAETGFVETVRQALAASSLPAHRLEIEITESVLLQKDDANIGTLHALRDLGASIVLDDFGTGYSSLSYLKLFPFDKLKIDKSFVDDVTTHAGCAAIVAATATLARTFDIGTIAEGVETEQQATALRAAGVTLMQGYAFGRPAPAHEWTVVQGKIVPGRPDQSTRAA